MKEKNLYIELRIVVHCDNCKRRINKISNLLLKAMKFVRIQGLRSLLPMLHADKHLYIFKAQVKLCFTSAFNRF